MAWQASSKEVAGGDLGPDSGTPEGEILIPERLFGLILGPDSTSMRYSQYAVVLEPKLRFVGEKSRALMFHTLDGKKLEVVTEAFC